MAAKDARDLLNAENRAEIERTVVGAVDSLGGYETVEIRYTKEFGKLNLTVFIWNEDEITLDDCERVHNAVSDALDAKESLFPDDYVLNVSSSGLDRPIVTDDDFRRALGTEIEAVADREKTHGILKAYDAESFTLITDGRPPKEKIIFRNNKTKVQPYIRF